MQLKRRRVENGKDPGGDSVDTQRANSRVRRGRTHGSSPCCPKMKNAFEVVKVVPQELVLEIPCEHAVERVERKRRKEGEKNE